jgi:hypothetical protein
VFQGEEAKKYEATFLLHKEKDADQIANIERVIEEFKLATFGEGKTPKSLKLTGFMDGDTKDYDGYANHMALKATTSRRTVVIDRDKTPLVEDDGKPYAGCYVNGIVSPWFSDHPTGGKQILFNLEGIQFWKDGAPFGDAGISVDAFDVFGDDDEDDYV